MIGFAAATGPAHADFQLSPTLPGAAQSGQAAPRSIVLSPQDPVTMRRPAATLLVPIAHGFGSQVPLAFATRQIVPAGVKATFGQGVDQSTLVDWAGGRPWIEVLRAAVQPLGLHITVRWMAISITKE